MNLTFMMVWLAMTLNMPLVDVEKTKIESMPFQNYAMYFCPGGDCASVGPSIWDGETVYVISELEEEYNKDADIGSFVVHNMVHDVRFRMAYNKNKEKFGDNFPLEEQAAINIQKEYIVWAKTKTEVKNR